MPTMTQSRDAYINAVAHERIPEPVDVETGEPMDDWGYADTERQGFIAGAQFMAEHVDELARVLQQLHELCTTARNNDDDSLGEVEALLDQLPVARLAELTDAGLDKRDAADAAVIDIVLEARKMDPIGASRFGAPRGVFTIAELTWALGPDWREVVSLVRKTSKLTFEQLTAMAELTHQRDIATIERLAEAHGRAVVFDDGVFHSRDQRHLVESVVTVVGLGHLGSAGAIAFDGSTPAINAAKGLAMRHRIGTDRFRKTDYDALVSEWVQVMGSVHPKD